MHRRMRSRRLAGLAQREPSTRYLDVQVGLGPARHLLQDLVPTDRFRDRQVDRVIPAGRSLGDRHMPAQLEAEEVLVTEDMLEDIVVAPQSATLETRIGPRAMPLRAIQELHVLSR